MIRRFGDLDANDEFVEMGPPIFFYRISKRWLG